VLPIVTRSKNWLVLFLQREWTADRIDLGSSFGWRAHKESFAACSLQKSQDTKATGEIASKDDTKKRQYAVSYLYEGDDSTSKDV
jgi:hypothetical protein